MIKICCISDSHGNLGFTVPECDLLLIAGDICPGKRKAESWLQTQWLNGIFRCWLGLQPIKKTVVTFGNHDWCAEIPPVEISDDIPNCTFLIDQSCEAWGLKIWATPRSLPFNNWAFNTPEDRLALLFETVPDDIDIIISHGPPKGYGDYVPRNKENVGSNALLERMNQLPNLKAVITGHVHEGYGVYKHPHALVVNCTLVDYNYKLSNAPVMLAYDGAITPIP